MKIRLAALAVLFALIWNPCSAQVTVDYAKITCQQFLMDEVAPTQIITTWLNGYFNAKRNNTIVNQEAMEKNVQKLSQYCYENRETLVMDAAKHVLGLDK